MHIDKNQEVVYNIIVKKRGGTMSVEASKWSDLTDRVQELSRLAVLYGPILAEGQKRIADGYKSSKYINNVNTMQAVYEAVGKNIRTFSKYIKANKPETEDDDAPIKAIMKGIREGFKGEAEFIGPKDGKIYTFTDSIEYGGSKYSVALNTLASCAVNVDLHGASSDRAKSLLDYSSRLASIYQALYGDGTLYSRGYKGQIEDYKGKWAHFPSAEQERALKIMQGIFDQVAANYKSLKVEFDKVMQDSETELSAEFQSGIIFTQDGVLGKGAATPNIEQTVEINVTKRKTETANASIPALEDALGDAETIQKNISKVRKFANEHSGVIKGGIAVAIIATLIGGGIGGAKEYRDRHPVIKEVEINRPAYTHTVEDFQQEINNRIEELKKASANWAQEYQEMFAPYLNGTNDTYNALMDMDSTSTSEDDIKLAESLSDTILTDLTRIETLAENATQAIPEKPIVLEGSKLSSLSAIWNFSNPFVSGTPTKVELDFIQSGERQGDADVKIYFTNPDGSVSYIKEVGIDNATSFIREDGTVDPTELNARLSAADTSASNVSTLINHIEEFKGLTTADGVAVEEFYVDEYDLSKLAEGGKGSIDWRIVLDDGRIIENTIQINNASKQEAGVLLKYVANMVKVTSANIDYEM